MTSNNAQTRDTKAEQEPWIGGPGTKLPFAVESFLAWTLALGCLAVSGYHYLIATFVTPTLTRLIAGSWGNHTNCDKKKPSLPCWLPLTTHSRGELDRTTFLERYQHLESMLLRLTKKSSSWSDEELVQVIRSNEICRRLASLVMSPNITEYEDVMVTSQQLDLMLQLTRIWPALLTLPPIDRQYYKFDISIIVPAFRERGADIKAKLLRALDACRFPERVQVVVVDAGFCINLKESVQNLKGWGQVKVTEFTAGGGRGPCLNYGASIATGKLYVFSHADTTMPKDWDIKVIKALCETHDNGKTRANSCAFSFGIDTSDAGLNGGPYPPGIKAVETTANIRTHLYSLPYGDQVLSVPAAIFDYVGGYPDQCLMEDYELISLLRRRAALLPKFGIQERERLVIIGDPPALCSPRRWQKFGVLYVTFMNSKFVNMYAGGMTPDDLFTVYYGSPPPKRSSKVSPWENDMIKSLHNTALQ